MPIDVRVIVAAQESVCAAAHDGRIRLDLYARLDGLVVQLPPLRDRREDIVPLFSRLWLDRTGGHRPTFDGKFAELLSTYDWPLNVRELVLLVRRLASIHGPGAQLKRSHLPERMLPLLRQQSGESEAPEAEPVKRVWRKLDDEEEFDALVAALRQNDGNVSRAAKSIGMDRNRANRLLAAHSEFSVQELRSGG
jgi:DNA-binding NtrC family response regulator